MRKKLLYSMMALLPAVGFGQNLHEGFNSVSTLTANGWTMLNLSDPLGTTSWFQGNPNSFAAYDGADSAYVGVNFNSVGALGTISNWLITPAVNVVDGDIVSFWTRTTSGSQWNDRIELRSSTGTTTLPASVSDLGSFTTLLLTVNEALDLTYPAVWTKYTATISGVGTTPVAMTFAFHYSVPDAGSSGSNSNYIGIDALYVGEVGGENPTVLCTPNLNCTEEDKITNVTFMEINNTTDCGTNGYNDFTSQTATVTAGSTNPIHVTVGGGWSVESVSVWIDLNSSNTFEAEEFTFIGTDSAATVTGNITIPSGTPNGAYRMRVRVAAVPQTAATADLACDNDQGYGETEDYTVLVGTGAGIATNQAAAFTHFPNPMADVLNFQSSKPVASVEAFNAMGQQVVVNTVITEGRIHVAALPAGIYVFRATMKDGSVATFKATKE